MSPTAANAIWLPSGEMHGRTMPSALRGSVGGEVAYAPRVLGLRHLKRGGERPPSGAAGVAECAAANLPVGHVDELGGRRPRRAEREDVLGAGDAWRRHLVAALPARRGVIHDLSAGCSTTGASSRAPLTVASLRCARSATDTAQMDWLLSRVEAKAISRSSGDQRRHEVLRRVLRQLRAVRRDGVSSIQML